MKNRPLRWLASPLWGFASTILFALYNGALGLSYTSAWHGSICAYYLLLSVLRGLLLSAQRKAESSHTSGRGRPHVLCAFALVLMNLALVAPVSLMVLDQRPVRMGMIPLAAASSDAVLLVIFVLSLLWLIRTARDEITP